MNRFIVATLAAVLALSACSGDGTNPFDDETEETEDGTDGDAEGVTGDDTLPPGTESPSLDNSIVRTEPTEADGGNTGDGFVTEVVYNADDDTIYVDNLAFDGENVYSRGKAVSSLGPYAVYEGDQVVLDDLSGASVDQFTYRAIYGVSGSGNSQFAVVRTGSYVPYGFGGFIYQRNGGVTIPTSGQATYTGTTAGLRDYDGKGGLEYTTGDMELSVDFEDFNPNSGFSGDGVYGLVTNRRVFDLDGNDITNDIVTAINDDDGNVNLSALPTVRWVVGPSTSTVNGEITGEIFSTYTNLDGAEVEFETGNYYAIIAGDDAEEVVGVLVLESSTGAGDGITVRETSGFIVER